MRSNSQENGIHHTVGGFFSIHGNYLFESVRSEVLITVVDRLGDTIRIENRQIAGAAFNCMLARIPRIQRYCTERLAQDLWRPLIVQAVRNCAWRNRTADKIVIRTKNTRTIS